jgi:pyruvate/2-oxoglutarate dehydrogenase complex dihydrolipoamide dehydrogenase (E3) component
MYEVVVVGGGPAGVTAALRARELGAGVALVERERLGGTCTNDGCVPTRVLAHAARLVRDAHQFADYGLVGEPPEVDFPKLLERTRRLVEEVHEKKRLVERLEDAGVDVFAGVGAARFAGESSLVLGDGRRLEAEKFVLCAGGHARRLGLPGAEFALTHSDVWTLRDLPRSVAVVGAAATGCQLASVFAAFGARVSLLELAPRILAAEDEAVSAAVAEAFERRGIELVTGIDGVTRIEESPEGRRLVYSRGGEEGALEVAAVVFAVGWPGNADELDLAAAGVEVGQGGYVLVDDTLRTAEPHVFAAGDLTGRMMLVQSATHEAEVAAENAVLDGTRTLRHAVVPHGGFTDPEYGSVGLTEEEARREHDCAVAVVPYADLDRGIIDGRTGGSCKLVVSRASRRILGAHIVGEQAVEVVQIAATGMRAGMRVEQLADLELAYPTFTAVVGLAARRISRDLGLVPRAPSTGSDGSERLRAAEWELRSG